MSESLRSEGGEERSLICLSGAQSPGAANRFNNSVERVSFSRDELRSLLNLYGRNVSTGAWCDYAMDFLYDRALFSIYRANSSHALYTIEKRPSLRNKQGQYLVVNRQGRVLKRGHGLERVLRVLDPGFALVK
ncbi:MAG TPA: DUF2794 domain-containing protein [Devosia sp.]|nr:DUF2794 domain-containing protein [Devosia sp.]